MMKLDIDTNEKAVKKLEQLMAKYSNESFQKEINKVTRVTAFKTAKFMREELDKSLKKKNKWVINSVVAFDKNYKDESLEPEWYVGFKRRNTIPNADTGFYLTAEVDGEKRLEKRFEYKLKLLGAMPHDKIAIPAEGSLGATPGMQSSQWGGFLRALINYFTVNHPGNTTGSGNIRGVYKNSQFFTVQTPNSQGLSPGIYARVGHGYQKILAFINSRNYRKTFKFYDSAREYSNRTFRQLMIERIDAINKRFGI